MILRLLAVLFGGLGVIGCVAGFVGALRLESRLRPANERVFTAVDGAFANSRERVRDVRERVQSSAITTGEVRDVLKHWAAKAAADRLVPRTEIDRRIDHLAAGLQRAEDGIESAGDSLRGVQQLLELGQRLGATMEPAKLDDAIQRLDGACDVLKKSGQSLDDLCKFAVEVEGESESTRLERIAKLIGRILLMIGDVEERLTAFEERLLAWQSEACEMKMSTDRSIVKCTLYACVALLWIAAGQIALVRCGRNARNGS